MDLADSEYRAQLSRSIEGAIKYLQDNHYSVVMSDIEKKLPEVQDMVIRELKKINSLPESQRAEAI